MPLSKLGFKPGINREGTNYSNEGGWFDGDKIRFRSGYVERIGGWTRVTNDVIIGTARKIFDFVTLASQNLLFIGTLYKEKGIFELLTAYKNAFFNNADIPILNVIGDGKEMSKIIQWINKNELNNKIYLRGAIYDSATLEYYFKNAIACISPSQAGLSVLLSMGYGVPFITNFNSITGGERLNIKNNQTGILYKKHSDLMKIILDICVDKIKYLNMGIKAKKFYNEHRTANHMVSGFINAINYVTK